MDGQFTRGYQLPGINYGYSAAYQVSGRGISWKATVLGHGAPFALSGEIEMDGGPFDAETVVAKEVELQIHQLHR